MGLALGGGGERSQARSCALFPEEALRRVQCPVLGGHARRERTGERV